MAKKSTRRGNNEGSIYQLKDGRWAAAVTLGYDENGKRYRKVFYGNTRAEIVIKMTTVLSTKLKGGQLSIKEDTLQVLMLEWLMTFKVAEVSARTFEANLRTVNLHVFPFIGEWKINEVTAIAAQSLLNKMLINGYALDTVRKVKFLLCQFYKYAMKCGFVSENPIEECKVKNIREHREQITEKYKAIPADIRKKFLSVIQQNEILEPICMSQIYGGMRIGEVLALKWKDVDFNKKTIYIDNAITSIPIWNSEGKIIERKTVISFTKTAASEREIPLSRPLEKCLLKWKETRSLRQERTGISLVEENDLVFSNNEGKLRTYGGTRCMFNRLLKANGLNKYNIHFHTLRHTFSTILFESGENPKVIQQLLGHKDVTTTIKTYNSVDRSYYKQATDKLELALK